MNREPSTSPEWKTQNAAPDRADVAAATELAELRRVLAIDVTAATFIPGHEWVLRSSAPVRLEIHAGTTLAEVMDALGRLRELVPRYWDYLKDEVGAMAVSRMYERADFRNGTIDGIAARDWTPDAETEDGSNAV